MVVNPRAGGGTEPGVVADALRAAGAEVDVLGLHGVEAVLTGHYDRAVAAGGDGTIAPVAATAARAGIPLAVVPTGTANDLAAAMGIPADVRAACRLAVRGEPGRALDLAWMGERPFLNVASAGLAVTAARAAAAWKRRAGRLAYAIGAARAAIRCLPVRCRVVADGEELFAGEAWQVMVANTGAFGGGSRIDAAEPDDRRLDAAVLVAGPRVALARHAYALRTGGITEQAGVRHARARAVDVHVPGDTSYNVDGEIVRAGAARFRVDPAAVHLVTGAEGGGR
jgi:diacylglycerol kinase (ATP)